jgi:hypothetical protein
MRASQHDLGSPVAWGELGVTNAGTLAGRCEGTCRGHHWGYVISGVVRVSYPDHGEVLTAGDAYYVAPGHLAIDVGDAELVAFTSGGRA